MQNVQHPIRSFPFRSCGVGRWQVVGHIVLVVASFGFIGAVTLGLFP